MREKVLPYFCSSRKYEFSTGKAERKPIDRRDICDGVFFSQTRQRVSYLQGRKKEICRDRIFLCALMRCGTHTYAY